jgi:hypothetical protein
MTIKHPIDLTQRTQCGHPQIRTELTTDCADFTDAFYSHNPRNPR